MLISIHVLIWAIVFVKDSECLYCLSCSDVIQPRDCLTLEKCGPHEICYERQTVYNSGQIKHDLGCRDRIQCQGNIVTGGKRRSVGGLPICEQCCDTDLCQPTLCGTKGFLVPHGPICFSCESQVGFSCDTYSICSRDEVCVENMVHLSGTGDVLIKRGCFRKQACESMKSIMIGKRLASKRNTCFDCCSGFLCNDNCSTMTSSQAVTQPLTATTATTTIAIPTRPPRPCYDLTPEETCRLAAVIVCTDRDKAMVSNCLHSCGYC